VTELFKIISVDEIARRRYGKSVEDLDESDVKELAAWLASEIMGSLKSGSRYVRIKAQTGYIASVIEYSIKNRLCSPTAGEVIECQYAYYERGEDAYTYKCDMYVACYIAALAYAITRRFDISISDVLSYLKIIDAVAVEIVTSESYRLIIKILIFKSGEKEKHAKASQSESVQ